MKAREEMRKRLYTRAGHYNGVTGFKKVVN